MTMTKTPHPEHERALKVQAALSKERLSMPYTWTLQQVVRHAGYVDGGGGTDAERLRRMVDCIRALVRRP